MAKYEEHDDALAKLRNTKLTPQPHSAVTAKRKKIDKLVAKATKANEHYLQVVREWKTEDDETYYHFMTDASLKRARYVRGARRGNKAQDEDN